jgi:hypothetical protein
MSNLTNRIADLLCPASASKLAPIEKLQTQVASSHAEFDVLAAHMGRDFLAHRAMEMDLSAAMPKGPVSYPGTCGICAVNVAYTADRGLEFTNERAQAEPHWREMLVCPCGLNTRLRGALHFLMSEVGMNPASRVYLSEQTTPFFQAISGLCHHTTGSEYLADGTARGQTNANGLRHEDITDLTFADGIFDIIGSFEVLEHVPDYRAGLREMCRVLCPGGALVATFPFRSDLTETLVRARMLPSGEIEHILPAEYHGDPVVADGILCFYHFGWDILDDMRAAGFSRAECHMYWSKEHGYLGGVNLQFLAIK